MLLQCEFHTIIQVLWAKRKAGRRGGGGGRQGRKERKQKDEKKKQRRKALQEERKKRRPSTKKNAETKSNKSSSQAVPSGLATGITARGRTKKQSIRENLPPVSGRERERERERKKEARYKALNFDVSNARSAYV